MINQVISEGKTMSVGEVTQYGAIERFFIENGGVKADCDKMKGVFAKHLYPINEAVKDITTILSNFDKQEVITIKNKINE